MRILSNLEGSHLFRGHLSSSPPLKKFLKCLLATLVALAILISFTIKSLMLPSFIQFDEIKQVLIPRTDLNSSSRNVCYHKLENNLSRDSLHIEFGVTEENLYFLSQNLMVNHGGWWSPVNCTSKYRVNIIVPYRNREAQLRTFLHYFHRFLQHQEIEYRIAVVEQNNDKQFNRAKLFNIGFVEMEKHFPANCYIFHDVDLIPLNLNNIYACTVQPRHISSALDVFDFQLPYSTIFGGAVSMTRSQFQQVNGYSNSFYGWGGEDDDFYSRVINAKYTVMRFESNIARMIMLNHTKEMPNPIRYQTLMQGRHRYSTDGLRNLKYSLLRFGLKPLHTWIYVNL